MTSATPIRASRAEEVAEAQRLRAEGLTYREIGERFGVSKQTARRWANPEIYQEHLRVCQEWKDRNRERKRAADRRYDATHKKPCTRCGGPRDRNRDEAMCGRCVAAVAQERRETIHRLWHAGFAISEIAAAIGSTPNATGVAIVHMRRDGWDLPYRYAMENGKRVAA